MFEINYLLTSMFWGTVGSGCLFYGKKQAAAPPLIAGFTLISVSFFIHSALLLSGVSLLCLVAMIWAIRRGF